MRFRFSYGVPIHSLYLRLSRQHHHQRQFFTSLFKKLQSSTPTARAAFSGNGGNSKGNEFLVPGATAATLLMLAALHARRLYEDKKAEEAREKGIEFEFKPDVKASFMRMLPLRPISRVWGSLTNMELPVWLRPHVYNAWARAFHSDLEETALPLDQYASLREFFTRALKEGSRPISSDPCCLVTG